MRAVGIADGSKVFGQGSVASRAVHVRSRSPVRPWTKTMLVKTISVYFARYEEVDILNSAVLWGVEKFDAGREGIIQRPTRYVKPVWSFTGLSQQ